METFTPIAMKCTQEQFEAIKPKLKGCRIRDIHSFNNLEYLSNSYGGNSNCVSNIHSSSKQDARLCYEYWNEEIFLKACGIEVESLEQQLQKAEAEVKRLQSLIEEENKPKIGDWVKSKINDTFLKLIQWID